MLPRCLLSMTLVAALAGCARTDTGASPDKPLRLEVSEDGTRWTCEAAGRRLVFLDPDNDGLADACEVTIGGKLSRKIILPRRMYGGFTPVAGGIKPESVSGINMVIRPVRPLTSATLRSERVLDPDFTEHLCAVLNDKSFTWREMEVILPKPEAIIGHFVPLPRFGPLGMEIWFEAEPEPLTIMLRFFEDSHGGPHYGLCAEWRGKEWLFGNDEIALLFSGFSGVGTAAQRERRHLFGAWDLPGGPLQEPTFFGGIPLRPDGKPAREVTLEDRANQSRELLNVYADYLKLD